ncbi:MAG: hypothetical protein CML98_07800 [Rhodobiaceae bacterium]|jgi:hypothetical protein|nr:hypothetical protein [Rhodobiaceae bacterium]|tara:strand:- start:14750 stop:15229 length:480 start_codon:yes stop_codon:yes gene_type:complete
MNKNLIKEDDQFVLVKLASGEMLVATLRQHTEETLSVEYPFELRIHQDKRKDQIVDVTAAAPFCGFAEDRKFTFKKSDIMFTKQLHTYSIPFYIELVEEYEKLIDVPVPKKSLFETQEMLRKTASDMIERNKDILGEDRYEDTSEIIDALLGIKKDTIH